MTLEIALDIAPDGGAGLTLTLSGAGASEVLARPLFTVDSTQLAKLRLGQAVEADTAPVADAISEWLLGTDLEARFVALLAGQDDIRVVLRADRELLARLSDVPLELVSLPNKILPLILNPRVTSFVRVAPTLGASPQLDARGWPFRVLIVRSNPVDLGGAVPEAATLRTAIAAIAEGMGLSDDNVRVDVLTSEQGGEPVTWKAFRDQLRLGPYHVLVYLGHGQVTKVDDGPAVGYLQFEEPNGHTPVDARSIAGELAQRPVRVVILAGCLTAAGGGMDDQLRDSLRGAQGVAQAIVDSEAPVDLAVGMRDLLEVGAANQLLAAFFRSLLRDHPGDVELSIREARSELFGNGRYPPSWSSAVVYAKGPASRLAFLGEKPPATAGQHEKQVTLEKAREIRGNIEKLFMGPIADRTPFLQVLAVFGEQDKQVIGKDLMIRPRFVQGAAGPVEIPIELLGALKVERLTGTVAIDGGAVIHGIVPAARLDGKFDVLSAFTADTVKYSIQPVAGGEVKLAAGPLFSISATVPGPAPALHHVTVTRARNDPERVVWPGSDLVVVTG
jgi:hypothetical protein